MKLLLKITLTLITLFIGIYYSSDFLLNFWWFSSLDLASFYLLRESYAAIVIIATTSAFTLLIYYNFSAIPRTLGLNAESKDILDFLQQRKKTLLLLSLAIAVPVLAPVYAHSEDFLLYFFSVQSELHDPVYSKNISYYLFSYPVYQLIQNQLLWVFALLLIIASSVYYLANKHRTDLSQSLPAPAKFHIALLVGCLILLQSWSIALERIEILYEDRHLPIFFGPGFVELNYYLPLIILSFILFLSAAITAIYTLYTGKKSKLAIALGLSYLLILAVKNFDFIPNLIDDYYVIPNPVVAESKSIQYHIQATKAAFNLSSIKQIDYPLESSLTANISLEIKRELTNIPLWDDDLLLPVYEQLQSIRAFYSFYHLATDRYLLDGKNQQVNVAARELDYQSLPAEAQNWRNEHLVYTHGNGMVMSPSLQQANRPMQWLLQNFGQSTELDKLQLTHPEIYYGSTDAAYAIVPNSESLTHAGSGLGDMHTDYEGTGGLALSSWLTKSVASAFFSDERIFFSTGISNKSRLLVRRNIFKRIKAIAPFLVIGKEATPVIADKKIVWIVDAYTSSDKYPLVETIALKNSVKIKPFNYARNSVKVIVDAYNGSVDFYITDNKDPIIKTYQRLYPSLFKSVDEAPPAIVKHFTYPKAWFALQIQLYSRFHQTNPEVFYQQSDALEMSKLGDKSMQPYYLTIDIEELENMLPKEQQKFILVSPLSPLGTDNLHSIAIAGCLNVADCNDHYQEDIHIYNFPKQIQIEGPAQISALMNQNPDISSQLTLWNQRGSKVTRGRMIIVPIEHSLLYIQPLYLKASTQQGFAGFAKVLVALNRHTVIADSLSSAFEQLEKKFASN